MSSACLSAVFHSICASVSLILPLSLIPPPPPPTPTPNEVRRHQNLYLHTQSHNKDCSSSVNPKPDVRTSGAAVKPNTGSPASLQELLETRIAFPGRLSKLLLLTHLSQGFETPASETSTLFFFFLLFPPLPSSSMANVFFRPSFLFLKITPVNTSSGLPFRL